MSRTFQTQYQALSPVYDENDDEQEDPPIDNIIQILPDQSRSRWNHIEDLDEFFTRVYQYHQRNGFVCMVVQDICQLVQFTFVVLFSTILATSVDYNVFFGNVFGNTTHKITFNDVFRPWDEAMKRFNIFICICLTIASILWVFRFVKIIYNIFKYWEIRSFYNYALKIHPRDLVNMTWHEVQRQLLEVQKDLQMCIHKAELTELDVYHRILRFKNYMIAMVNKSILPIRFDCPCFGTYTFLTSGLKYNLEMILFWGPWAPFENSWHLKKEFKSSYKRKELADQLSQKILWIGLANLVLSPVIFMWQILYSFFRYAEVAKRDPCTLGARHWSLYSRLFLRHFNELDHEFNARLSRAYRPADRYMNIFTSPLLEVISKHVAFISGSMLAVLLLLTVIDEDVLNVNHVFLVMTVLGGTIVICRLFIPDEYLVFNPELLMRTILAHIHYIPDTWKGQAHSYIVRSEFSRLFQYKVVSLLEELFSPIITPLMLCFSVRHKTQDIVDFFHNFTVDVTGVGDVCSFAQMNIKKHGQPEWTPEAAENENAPKGTSHQAEFGKTELSLMHFTLTNPEWHPQQAEDEFVNALRHHVQKDGAMLSMLPLENPLMTSSHSLTGPGYNSMLLSTVHRSLVYPSQQFSSESIMRPSFSSDPSATSTGPTASVMRGGLRNLDYPLGAASTSGIFSNIQHTDANRSNVVGGVLSPSDMLSGTAGCCRREYDEGTLELLSAEMSISALYLHDLHLLKMVRQSSDVNEDELARRLWQVAPPSSAPGPSVRMPNIQEGSEDSEASAAAAGNRGGSSSERNYLLDTLRNVSS